MARAAAMFRFVVALPIGAAAVAVAAGAASAGGGWQVAFTLDAVGCHASLCAPAGDGVYVEKTVIVTSS